MAETKKVETHKAAKVRSEAEGAAAVTVETIPDMLPILPVRHVVVFPGTIVPLTVGRARSKAAVDSVMLRERVIGVLLQKDPDADDPRPEQLHQVGVACIILKLLKLPEGQQSVIVHGLSRFRVTEFLPGEHFLQAKVETLTEKHRPSRELAALEANVRRQAERVIELLPNVTEEAQQALTNVKNPSSLADFLGANVRADTMVKQQILEALDVGDRLRMVASHLGTQLDVLELQERIQKQVSESIDKTQRRYYLQEQLRTIRKELGEGDGKGEQGDGPTLRKALEAAGVPEAVMKEANRELSRLEVVPMASPEYGVIRSYLQLLSELPWTKSTEDKIDLPRARTILDRDHYDLAKVKKRIVEFLAVRKLKPQGAGAILCFVGPPGVGKTSLGRSIAEAMGRKFARLSLGGVRDEAEIRGHRRTYIGAMPGRLIAEIRKAGANNPVVVLDEIDKLGADFRGDPASALLEVLDPAQNHSFTDHYLDVAFDLSKVLFIATANTMHTVPPALRDRLEVIEIPGYTDLEKEQIASRHLLPRQIEAHGLTATQFRINKPAMTLLIRSYTREAGVRNLERCIGSLARGVAAEIVSGKTKGVRVDKAKIEEYIGPHQYESEVAQRQRVPGVATGLAYTPVGGDILFIEAARMPGRGNMTLTGQMGRVMRESGQAAYTLVKARLRDLGVDPKLPAESDIHMHIPAGAIPKDGPSAGVAMFMALASLLTKRPIPGDMAMTGEITLRGLVLPVGGLKEKTLAAMRAGIRRVVLPARNRKDESEIPEEVRKGLKLIYVDKVDEVLKLAFPGLKPAKATGQKSPKTSAGKAPGQHKR